MSRLLHAAARGARIQGRWIDDTPQWHTVRKVYLVEDLPYQRIHPEDAHLQYGPISTALREMAEQYVWSTRWENQLANAAEKEFTEFFDSRTGEPDYPLFYLFLAEFLADEGL
jgi:hypothetical protein